MLWDAAEAAIQSHIRTQWALGSLAAIPLVFEAERPGQPDRFMQISIEGTYADKTIYGSTGKRSSVEGGIVYFHAFVPVTGGKAAAVTAVVTMTGILELQAISGGIYLDGGNPPSPVGHGDDLVPNAQPSGNYYRCSGSVPFILVGAR